MNISKLTNQKYYITDIELKGFKGTKEINNEDGILKLHFNTELDKKEIILIYAENGKGKSTILENLHAYPSMISRDIKQSIEYPAYKKITFKNNNQTLRFEIFWESENSTKGYIYVDDIKLPQTEKGNITEYKVMVEKIFLEFNKFKTSLFMQQGVLDIVKAKPAERAKIINNFSSPTISYDDIKQETLKKLDLIKQEINIYEKEIENYKGYENRYNDLKKFNEKEIRNNLEKLINDEKKLKLKLEEEENKKTFDEYKSKELLKLKSEQLIKTEKELKKELEEITKSIKELKQNTNNENVVIKVPQIEKLKTKQTEIQEDLNFFEINKNINFNAIKEKSEKKINEEIENKKIIIEKYDYIKLLMKQLNEIKIELKTIKENITSLNSLHNKDIEEVLKEEGQLEKYQKNLNLINNLLSIKNKLKEEIKEIETQKLPDIKIKEISLEISNLKKELEKEEKTYYSLEEKEKELKEYNKILLNIENGENEDIRCKCCKSILDINSINNHINKIKKELEIKELTEIKVKELKKQIKDLEEKENKINWFKKQIKEKIDELKAEKFQDLENKKMKTENILKQLQKHFEITKQIKDLKEQFESKLNKKEEIHKQLEIVSIDIIEEIKNKEKIEIKKDLIQLELIKDMKEKVLKYNIEQSDFNIFILKLKEKLNQHIKEREILEKEVEEYTNTINKINNLNETKIKKENELNNQRQIKDKIEEITKQLEENNFNIEIYEAISQKYKEIIEEIKTIEQSITEYEKDKEFIEKMMKEFIEKKEKIEELKKEEFIYKKIKIYSDRIKKAQVSNFFAGITETINQIIETEEGSLKNLKVSITQKGNKNLNINTRTKLNTAEDISLLSGAEQIVVSRGISLALAKEHNFGIVYMDESDGALDKKNKNQFINTLRKTKTMVGTNQLFVISHNEDLLLLVDEVIKL
jgi:DNA repair exonuclease SbcCD ATPase subunit